MSVCVCLTDFLTFSLQLFFTAIVKFFTSVAVTVSVLYVLLLLLLLLLLMLYLSIAFCHNISLTVIVFIINSTVATVVDDVSWPLC